MSNPFVIGLTGSIGMGKTTTANMFRDAGIPVWDADTAVHDLYEGPAVEAIFNIRPQAIVDGKVHRAALADWVLQDKGALQKIETVIHPLVAQSRAAFLREVTVPFAVLDIPLLFETGLEKSVDLVIVVTTSEDQQRERVMARSGMTEEKFLALKLKQMPDAEKRARADIVIETTSLEGTKLAVQHAIEQIEDRLRNDAGNRP